LILEATDKAGPSAIDFFAWVRAFERSMLKKKKGFYSAY
jgi:hypothetical protein